MTNILYDIIHGHIYHQGMEYEINKREVRVLDSGMLQFIFGTLNSLNCLQSEIETKIDDFKSNKYMYVDGKVELNPDYVEEV